MIWIVVGDESHQIISCNVHKWDNEYAKLELWVTRPNGKNLKIKEGNKEEIMELKEAIDYAIENGETAFRIK